MSTTWRSRVTSTSSSAKPKKQRNDSESRNAQRAERQQQHRAREQAAQHDKNTNLREAEKTQQQVERELTRKDSARRRKKTFTSRRVSTSGTEHYDNGQKKQTLRVQHQETLSIQMCCKSLMSSIRDQTPSQAPQPPLPPDGKIDISNLPSWYDRFLEHAHIHFSVT